MTFPPFAHGTKEGLPARLVSQQSFARDFPFFDEAV